MGTSDPLRSSYLKLGRANDHIESLNEAVDGFLDTDPYMVKTDFYEKPQEFVLRLQIRESPPRESVSSSVMSSTISEPLSTT